MKKKVDSIKAQTWITVKISDQERSNDLTTERGPSVDSDETNDDFDS